MNDALISQIRRRMEAAGYNQLSLAKAAGLNDGYVRDIFRGKSRNPRIDDLMRIAQALECDITELLPPANSAAQQSRGSVGLREKTGHFQKDGNVIFSADRSNHPINDRVDDLPVYGTGSCGENGRFDMNGQIVDYVSRPERLRGIANAYAVYAAGDSMEPRYFHGELLYVHPGRPITPGCFVIVQIQPEHEGDLVQAFVKQLVRVDNKVLVLREFNPAVREITIPRSSVLDVHRIVQSGESG